MFKTIFKHGSGYIFVSLLTKGIGFLLLPFITRVLTLDEYGLYTNILSAQSIIYLFGTLGLDSAYGRFVYDHNGSKNKLRLLTSTIFTAYIIWNLIYILLSSVAMYYLIDSWGSSELFIAFSLPLISMFTQFSALNISLMQSKHETKKLLKISVASFFLTQVILVVCLFFFRVGVQSFYIAQLTASFIFAIVHVRLLVKEKLIHMFFFSRKLLKRTSTYALGYMPLSFSNWIFSLSDRYVITYYISLSMSGSYSFIMQFTIIMQTVSQSIDTAFTPIFMKLMKDGGEDSLKALQNYIKVVVFLFLAIYVAMAIYLPFVITIFFPAEYQSNYSIIPLVFLGVFFLAMRKIFANVLVFYKKSLWIGMSGYIPAIVNLLLNFILIPIYGVYAAAATTLLSYFIYFVMVFIMSQRLRKLEFQYLDYILMLALSIMVTYLGMRVDSLFYCTLLFLLFLACGHFLGIYKLIKG